MGVSLEYMVNITIITTLLLTGVCGDCWYNGTNHKTGDVFPALDGCNFCSCLSSGTAGCSDSVCPQACTDNFSGAGVAIGGTFAALDNCNVCTCKSDLTHECTNNAKCTGCHDNGIIIPFDGSTIGVDGCNTVSCSRGGIITTLIACSDQDHYTCAYNNNYYHSGDSFKSADGCNDCTCSTDGVSCTEKACANTLFDQRCFYYGDYYCPTETFRIGAVVRCDSCYCDGTTGYPTCLLKKCLNYSRKFQPGDCTTPSGALKVQHTVSLCVGFVLFYFFN